MLLNNDTKKRKVKLNKQFDDERFTFNFSYISTKKSFDYKSLTKKEKASFLGAVIRLSSASKIEVLNWKGSTGLENIREDQVSLKGISEFLNSGRLKYCDDGYWVFRFHGDTDTSRGIGKVSNNVFYILAIDKSGKAYNHGA